MHTGRACRYDDGGWLGGMQNTNRISSLHNCMLNKDLIFSIRQISVAQQQQAQAQANLLAQVD